MVTRLTNIYLNNRLEQDHRAISRSLIGDRRPPSPLGDIRPDRWQARPNC
jgi:hypothetical protein